MGAGRVGPVRVLAQAQRGGPRRWKALEGASGLYMSDVVCGTSAALVYRSAVGSIRTWFIWLHVNVLR